MEMDFRQYTNLIHYCKNENGGDCKNEGGGIKTFSGAAPALDHHRRPDNLCGFWQLAIARMQCCQRLQFFRAGAVPLYFPHGRPDILLPPRRHLGIASIIVVIVHRGSSMPRPSRLPGRECGNARGRSSQRYPSCPRLARLPRRRAEQPRRRSVSQLFHFFFNFQFLYLYLYLKRH